MRERVAERKEQDQKDKRGARAGTTEREDKSTASDAARREQSRLLWGRVAMLGTVLQAVGLLLVIVEVFLLWSASGDWDRWQWLIIYCIVFGAGRVLKMAGDAQRKLRR